MSLSQFAYAVLAGGILGTIFVFWFGRHKCHKHNSPLFFDGEWVTCKKGCKFGSKGWAFDVKKLPKP